VDYGTFLARAIGGICISYKVYGSYSGDYIAIIEKGHDWLIYKGHYGSCSGCDWLNSTRIYSDEDYDRLEESDYGEEAAALEATFQIKPEVLEEYLEENEPFLIIPKSQLPDTLEDFKALLPANTRTITDDEWEDVDQDALVFEQMKNFDLDNLKYLEEKHKEEELQSGK
jgi:hypothetical protein